MEQDRPDIPGPPRLKTLQNTFFLAMLLAASGAFVWLVQDFLQPVFWAAVLAVLFYPFYQRCLRRVKGRAALASVLTILVILVLVILPLVLVGVAVTNEAVGLYERLRSGEIDVQAPLEAIENAVPVVDAFLDRFGVELEKVREGLSNAAVTVSRYLASQALAIGQDALRVGVMFFIMLYLLFFFFRDGRRLVDVLIRALPLGDERERRLFAKFAEVSRATIKSTLIVGVVQGTLGGVLFWILGIRAAVFWGVIMTLLSLLPAVGSGLVWGPAALIFFATGEVGKGLVLLAAGVLLIGLVDNLLRPLLVGRDTRMPDYLILLSTLGGLAVFGLSGFVIGPVIAALFLAVWEMFMQEYGGADDAEAEAAPSPAAEPLPAPPDAEGEDG